MKLSIGFSLTKNKFSNHGDVTSGQRKAWNFVTTYKIIT